MPLLIGLDIGTTKLATLALDADSGKVVASVSTPNSARRDTTASGLTRAELDMGVLNRLTLALLRDLIGQLPDASQVLGIGVTGQQHGVAFMDATGQPIGPAITWQDQRALEPAHHALTYLQAMTADAGGAVRFHNMGCQPAAGYLGSTLYWLSRRNALSANAHLGFIPDAVVATLIGRLPVTDPTLAGSSALYDLKYDRWDAALLADLGLTAARLPAVQPTGSLAGALCAENARYIGLPAGLPIAAALGDNQASFIGSVPFPAENILVNMGTGGQISALVNEFCRLDGVDTRAFPEGGYLLVGAGSSGGRTLGYLRDLVADIGRCVFGVDRDDLYEQLVALADQAPPGAAGISCVPHFAGTRASPSDAASWSGLTAANLSLGNLTRALIEGVAADAHAFWLRMAPLVGPRHTLVGAGNGLLLNPVLCEALTTAFELPLTLAPRNEAAACGAALTAGVAAGAYPTFGVAMRRLAAP